MIKFFNNSNDFVFYHFEKFFFNDKDFIKITVIDNTHNSMLNIYKIYTKELENYLESFNILESFPLVACYNGKNLKLDINF